MNCLFIHPGWPYSRDSFATYIIMSLLYHKRLDCQWNTNESGPNLPSSWKKNKTRNLVYNPNYKINVLSQFGVSFPQIGPPSFQPLSALQRLTTTHARSSSAPSAHAESGRRSTGLQRTCQGSHVFQNLESIQGEVRATCQDCEGHRGTGRLSRMLSIQNWSPLGSSYESRMSSEKMMFWLTLELKTS